MGKKQHVNRKYIVPLDQKTGSLTRLTDDGYAAITRMSAEGHDLITIAEYLGVNKETFREIRRRDPIAQEAIDRGRAKLGDELTNMLLKQARQGNTTAAIFLAKARLGWRDVGAVPDGAQNNTQVNIYLQEPLSDAQFKSLMNPHSAPTAKQTGDE